jgi:hypothetical protein
MAQKEWICKEEGRMGGREREMVSKKLRRRRRGVERRNERKKEQSKGMQYK